MSALKDTQDILLDAVSETAGGGTLQVVTNRAGGGWRTACLLALAAGAMHVESAFAGAVQEGRVQVRELSGVVRDVNQVLYSADRVKAAQARGNTLGTLYAIEAILSTASKYERRYEQAQPSSTAKGVTQGRVQPSAPSRDFLGDFRFDD